MICGCSDSQCQCDRYGGVGGGRMLMTTIEVQKKITRPGLGLDFRPVQGPSVNTLDVLINVFIPNDCYTPIWSP